MSEPANDRVGELVDGRYRLLALVGRGGMADVYRARDELLGRVVAVKVMRAETGVEAEDALRRHEMEARIGAGVSHPGVVTVFDVQPEGEHPYLVMEFVPGQTLSRVLLGGPLPSEVVADIGAQLGEALGAIHDAGVIHRDVKPSNVMLVERTGGSYQVKLTDFGVSRYLEGTRLTSPDLLVGTARYLSPEQAVLDEVGPQADVYALGLVLLEALTGEEAFPGSRVETLSARLHRQPRVPIELGADWALVLGAMTRRDPADRPDARGAASALRALAGGGDVAAALTAAGVAIGDPAGEETVVGGAPVDDDPTEQAGTAAGAAAVLAGGAAGAALAHAADAEADTAAAAADAADTADTAVAPAAADTAVAPAVTADTAGEPAVDTAGQPAVEQPVPDPTGTTGTGAGDGGDGDGTGAWSRRLPWVVVAVVVLAAAGAVWWSLASNNGDPETPVDPTTTQTTPTPTRDTSRTPQQTTSTEPTPTRPTSTRTTPSPTPTTPSPTPTTTAPPTTTPPTTAPPTTAPPTTTAPPPEAPTPTDDGEALPTPGSEPSPPRTG